MVGVLGVSVGAGFVRLAWTGGTGTDARQSIAVGDRRPEEVAAEAVGVALAHAAESGTRLGVGIAYGDEAQAAALDAALRSQGITRFRLIRDVDATLAALRRDPRMVAVRTAVLYDLGSAGLTVSVVDRSTAAVLASERSTAVSGDSFPAAAVAESAELVGELVEQSGATAEAVVLVGGGAQIPEVASALRQHSAVPVLTPPEPAFAAAVGAAALTDVPPSRRLVVPRRRVGGAGLAGAALVVLALVAIGLGYGRTLFGSQAGAAPGTPTITFSIVPAAPSATAVSPPPDDPTTQPAPSF